MAGAKIFEDKARRGFRFFDLNKDGIITKEEMSEAADRVSALSSASTFQRDCTRAQFLKWVDALWPEGSINETDFFERVYKLWSNERQSVEFECSESYRHIFKGMDANKDGFVSRAELLDFYKAFGYPDKTFSEKVFTALDKNKDDLISEEEFTEAFTKYWSDEPVFEFVFDPPQ